MAEALQTIYGLSLLPSPPPSSSPLPSIYNPSSIYNTSSSIYNSSSSIYNSSNCKTHS